jgi:succinate dehydrogenase / fumarate reductase flavoprotein subunit
MVRHVLRRAEDDLLLDRMGVAFNRTAEGLLDFRRFGGTLFNRTAFAGATTGQQLIYALDEQVRRLEAEGKARRFEHHLQSLVLIASNCRGITPTDINGMQTAALLGDVGDARGIGMLYPHTNSMICTGSAPAATSRAWYANGEFIQHPPDGDPRHRAG